MKSITVKLDERLVREFREALKVHNASDLGRLDMSKVVREAVIKFIKKTNKKY